MICFCLIAVVLGGFHAVAERHVMGSDGISYLDLSDAFRTGDWRAGVNSYWSPLYPAVLGLVLGLTRPSPYWEFAIVHLTNFILYLFALAAFTFFLRSFRYYIKMVCQKDEAGQSVAQATWVLFGYALFVWSSIKLITLSNVSPDMCVSIFFYAASGLLLLIRVGRRSWFNYLLLGVVLGLGYYAKAPVFPLVPFFLVLSAIAFGNLRAGLYRAAAAAAIFSFISSPLIYQLSKSQGHLTFGESAAVNYLYYTNAVPRFYWQSATTHENKTGNYPAQQLFAHPSVYLLTVPHRGTYPYWYDPPAWFRGVSPRLDLRGMFRQSKENLYVYYNAFFHLLPAVPVAVLILCIWQFRRKNLLKRVIAHWIVWTVPVIGLAMYVSVHVENRHVAPMIVLLILGVFAALCQSASAEDRRWFSAMVSGVSIFILFQLGMECLAETSSLHVREFLAPRNTGADFNVAAQVADGLRSSGLNPGNKIAWLRPARFDAQSNYWWARILRLQTVAEIPDSAAFWSVDGRVRSEAISSLAHTGVKALVINCPCDRDELADFHRAGTTDYYVHLFSQPSGGSYQQVSSAAPMSQVRGIYR